MSEDELFFKRKFETVTNAKKGMVICMNCLLDEIRKHRVFREVYIGVIVAAAFFVFSFYTIGSSDGNWFLIQQAVWNVTVCVSIVVIMGISRLFCYEDERGTDFLIGSAKHGRSKTFFAKLMIAVAICFAAVLVFSALNLIVDHALSDPEMVENSNFIREARPIR